VNYATLTANFHCHVPDKTDEELAQEIAKYAQLYPLETVSVEWIGPPYHRMTIHTRRPEELQKQLTTESFKQYLGTMIGCNGKDFVVANIEVPEGLTADGQPLHCLDEVNFNCTVGTFSYGKTCADLNDQNREAWCLTETLGFSYACCECNNEHLSYRGYRGGYLSVGPNGTFEKNFEREGIDDLGVNISANLASDIDMDLEGFWTISGWVRGPRSPPPDNRKKDADFDIIRRCTQMDAEGFTTCYGIGIRDLQPCFIWERFKMDGDGLKDRGTDFLTKISVLSSDRGWGDRNAAAQASFIALSYDNGFISPWFNDEPLQARFISEEDKDCMIYVGSSCEDDGRRSLVQQEKYVYDSIVLGSANAYWVADLRYYDSLTDEDILMVRYDIQKPTYFSVAQYEPDPTMQPSVQDDTFDEKIVKEAEENFYFVLFPFFIFIAGKIYNKILDIGPMKNIPVLVFCFQMMDTVLDGLFTVKLLGDNEVPKHLGYACAAFVMGPIIFNCIMFMTCIREKWSQGSHRTFRKNFGSIFFCLVATGGSMTSLSVLGSSLFADRKVFTSFPYLYIDDLPTYNILKILADIGFSGVHVLYVLEKGSVDLFVMSSISTSCIGLCYAISIFFASLIANQKNDFLSEFRMTVFCHVENPAARQNRVNNAIKSEYFSRSEMARYDRDFESGEELLEQYKDSWLRVEFVDQYSTTQCKVRVLSCPVVKGDPNLRDGAIRLVSTNELKRVNHVQRSLMPEVQLSSSGVCMEAVIYVHGPTKNLSWNWNWREAEQALEYGLRKAFPVRNVDGKKEKLYFVAIHPKRNRDNKFAKPFNDLMLQFLMELLEDHEGFEGAWQAIHEVWDDQPQVGSFDLDKHEFKRVWEVISIDKKLYETNFGHILTGRKGYNDNPALLKFIRQLATYTKTRMDQYAIDDGRPANANFDGDQFDGYDDLNYGGAQFTDARFLEQYHARSGSIATPFGLSNSQQDGYDQLKETVRDLEHQHVEMVGMKQNPTMVQGENTPGAGVSNASYSGSGSSKNAGGRRKSNLVNIDAIAGDWSKDQMDAHQAEILEQIRYLEAVSSGDEGTRQWENEPGGHGGGYNQFGLEDEDSDSEYVEDAADVMGHHDEPFSNEPFSMDDAEGHHMNETRPDVQNRLPGNQYMKSRHISETSTFETDLHDEFSDPDYYEDEELHTDGTYYSSQYSYPDGDVGSVNTDFSAFGGGSYVEEPLSEREQIELAQQQMLEHYSRNKQKPGAHKRNPHSHGLKRGPSTDLKESNVPGAPLPKSPARPKRRPRGRGLKRGPSKGGMIEASPPPTPNQFPVFGYEHEPSSPSGHNSISSPSHQHPRPYDRNDVFNQSTTSLPKPSLGKSNKLAVPGGFAHPNGPGSSRSSRSPGGSRKPFSGDPDEDESSITTVESGSYDDDMGGPEDIAYFNEPIFGKKSKASLPMHQKHDSQTSLQKPSMLSVQFENSNRVSNNKKKEYEHVNLYEEDDEHVGTYEAHHDLFGDPGDMGFMSDEYPPTPPLNTGSQLFCDNSGMVELEDQEIVMEYYNPVLPNREPAFHVSRSRSQHRHDIDIADQFEHLKVKATL